MSLDSLRFRLIAAGVVAILCILLGARFALVALFERHVERRVVAELGRNLDQLTALLEPAQGGTVILKRPMADPRFDTPLSGFYWQVELAHQRLRSRSLWDGDLRLEPGGVSSGKVQVRSIDGPQGVQLIALVRDITLSLGSEEVPARVIVASDRAEIATATAEFAANMLPYVLVLAALLAAGGALQIALGLRPLGTLRRGVEAIRSGSAEKLGAVYPSEVQPLALAIDDLLKDRARSITQAKGRAADLAHGLRTPLQVLEGDIARLQAKGEHKIASDIAMVAENMRRHVERELIRARAGYRQSNATAEASASVERVLSVVRRMSPDKPVQWRIDVPRGLWVAIDADDLTEALGNLAENAVRFARGAVAITVAEKDQRIAFEVRDDGPGIPPEHVDDVKARGTRLDERGGGAAGLGLAITDELIAAWGGEMELVSDPTGAVARFSLPKANPRAIEEMRRGDNQK